MADKDTFANYTGVQLDVVGMGIALAIRKTRKFGAAEHGIALDYIIKNSAPGSSVANQTRVGNVSAVRQDMEKAGHCDHSGGISALAKAVGEALDKLAVDEKAQAKK
jgi:hypothetical protein